MAGAVQNAINTVNTNRAGTPGGTLGYGTDAIAEAQRQGFYDPNGSPVLMARIRRQALRSARNRRRRGELTSTLLGLDPQQARAAQLAEARDSGAQTADTLGNAYTSELFGNRDYARSLLGGEIDYRRQRQLQDEANRARRNEAIYGGLGTLGGAYLGSL